MKTKEERAAYKQAWAKAHREQIAASSRKYYAAHKEHYAAYQRARKKQVALAGKKYRDTHKEKVAAYQAVHKEEKAAYKMTYKYGIAENDYNKMLVAQGGVCGICGKTNSSRKRLFIDHNHETGEVRGLLCCRCNLVLGQLMDNVDLVLKVALYLTRKKS